MQAYERWKLTPEWRWFVQLLTPPPMGANLTTRQKWMLADLGITHKTTASAFERVKRFDPNAPNTKEDDLPPPPPPPRDDLPKQDQNRENKQNERLIAAIQKLETDLAAVTRERDELRRLLLSAQQEQQQQQQQQQSSTMPPMTLQGGSAPPVFMAPPTAPPPPPPIALPPPAKQTTNKGEVANLLQALRGGVPLKPVPASAASGSKKKDDGGIRNTLSDAITNRRRASREDEIDCQMCYSEGTLQCVECKIATYCSPACQTQHWDQHAHVCMSSALRPQ